MEWLQNKMIAMFIVEHAKKLPNNKNVELLIYGLKDIINNMSTMTQTEKRGYIDAMLENRKF